MTTSAVGATSHLSALLRIAEDELQRLRGHMVAIAAFIHDPAHDLDARSHLARVPAHARHNTGGWVGGVARHATASTP